VNGNRSTKTGSCPVARAGWCIACKSVFVKAGPRFVSQPIAAERPKYDGILLISNANQGGRNVAKRKEPHPHGDDLREVGEKQRAGRALSELIRAIGQEQTEVVLDDGPRPGPPRIISKAESMARFIWFKALPHVGDDGVTYEPNIDYVKIILDRSDGKPGTPRQVDDDTGRESVPDRISRLNKERLNSLAADVTGDGEE
jgi:hypothetical protein